MPVSKLVNKGPQHLFWTCIDGIDLKDHPLDMFARGEFYQTDMILGFNTNEGLMFMRELMRDKHAASVTVDKAQELLKNIVFRR
jgi:carboxylesterase type B